MAMDSWSKNEYRTFITSRRDDVFENRETSESAFSFKRPPPLEVGHGDYNERDMQYDTDVKLHWENMVRMALQKPPSTEFEFQFKSAPVSPMLASLSHPEDDVFQGSSPLAQDRTFNAQRDYKEHPVYRKQVEFDEASKRAPTFVVSQRTVPEPFSQLSPGSLSRMYQPKYSKFCVNSTDVPPVETSMDSRSSSFRSQTSICEPTDRDTGDSSTSRDSNGSSNDASSVSTDTTFDRAFEAYEHHSSNATTPTLKSNVALKTIPCPNDRRSMLSATNAEYDKTAPNVSWLRSPLKWMGIVGAKKPPKSPRAEPRTEHDHRTTTRPISKLADMSCNAGEDVAKPRAVSRLFNPPTCDEKNLTNKRRSFLALPVHQPLGLKTVEVKSAHGLKLKPAFPSDSSDVHSVVSSDRERDQSGMLKIRERWLKYMRMLTPPYGKSSPKPDGVVVRGGSFPQQPTLRQEYVHTRPKSMPAILKTPPLRPRSNPGAVFQPSSSINIPGSRAHMPPAGPSSAKKSNSFLSHNGSLVSSSPRLLKSSSPRLLSLSPKVKSSPKFTNTISPRMSSSSASSMIELHSAVQGAIAHCKQSHSGLLSPAGHPPGNNFRHCSSNLIGP